MKKDRPTIDMPPVEKKRLSYLKDCRSTYGESDKGARKTIPRRKAIENRNDRHVARHELAILRDRSESEADLIESSLVHDVYRVGGWQKVPDTPLGEVVKSRKEARIGRAGRRVRKAEFWARMNAKPAKG
jgi:hypothetical protein